MICTFNFFYFRNQKPEQNELKSKIQQYLEFIQNYPKIRSASGAPF